MAARLKITILGAGGTLGKALADDLASRHDVHPITRTHCDIRDRNALRSLLLARRDHVIVNCAMVGGKQKLGSYDRDELHDNLLAFHNLSSMRDLYRVLINVGSGAEMDVSMPMTMVGEDALTTVMPRDSYGMAKNIIARTCAMQENAVNLRVFGCFDPREPGFRLMRRFVDAFHQGRQFVLAKDREMSWISCIDLGRVIEAVSRAWPDAPRDINCSYLEPIGCFDIISFWCHLHGVAPAVVVEERSQHSYTCDSRRLHGFLGPGTLVGLEESLRRYR